MCSTTAKYIECISRELRGTQDGKRLTGDAVRLKRLSHVEAKLATLETRELAAQAKTKARAKANIWAEPLLCCGQTVTRQSAALRLNMLSLEAHAMGKALAPR